MATQTLRPNGTQSASFWDRTGGSTKHGVLADDSDATYLTVNPADPGGGVEGARFALATYALAVGERVKRLRTRIRASHDGTGSTPNPYLEHWIWYGGEIATPKTYKSLTSSTPSSQSGGWSTPDELTASAQQAVIDALEYGFWGSEEEGSRAARVYEAYVDLDVWARTAAPTVASDPSGTITDTDLPTIESYVAALNDGTPSLYSREIRVFRDAVYLAGGFDPETETDVEWEFTDTSLGSVATSSGAPDQVQVDEPLANGDTYRAYVRIGKNDVAGRTLWSTWGYVQFTLDLTLPTAPAVTANVEPSSGRNQVLVTTAAVTHDTLESIRVERSDDGGTTWATIRGGYVAVDAAGDPLAGSTAYTFRDYDPPSDVAVTYRARVVEGITSSGTTLTSAWTTSSAVTLPNDGQWWLLDVGSWTRVLPGARIESDPEFEIVEDVGVFHPLGRDGEAVVVTGTVHGDDGAFGLRGTGTAECAAVDAIARWAGTVLVRSPFGGRRYVRWVSRSWRLSGTPARPRHDWDLGYVEVGSGIGADG